MPARLYLPCEQRRCEQVVEAPAQVALPGAGPVLPPRVVAGLAEMEDAEAVDEAEVEQRRERFPLARQEAGRVRRPRDVDPFGRDVEVACQQQPVGGRELVLRPVVQGAKMPELDGEP